MTQADIRPGAAASKERPDPAQRTAPPDTAAPGGSRGFTALPARPRGVALLARLSRSAAAVLPEGLAGRAEPPVAARGVLEIGSPEFRRACALMADGRFYVVRTYNTAAIGEELAVLGRRYRLPEITGRYPATLTEINALYEGAARAKARLRPGATRLLAALSDAAALRASDLKLAIRGVHADVRLKLANVEIDFGPEWSAQEARGTRFPGYSTTATRVRGRPRNARASTRPSRSRPARASPCPTVSWRCGSRRVLRVSRDWISS